MAHTREERACSGAFREVETGQRKGDDGRKEWHECWRRDEGNVNEDLTDDVTLKEGVLHSYAARVAEELESAVASEAIDEWGSDPLGCAAVERLEQRTRGFTNVPRFRAT